MADHPARALRLRASGLSEHFSTSPGAPIHRFSAYPSASRADHHCPVFLCCTTVGCRSRENSVLGIKRHDLQTLARRCHQHRPAATARRPPTAATHSHETNPRGRDPAADCTSRSSLRTVQPLRRFIARPSITGHSRSNIAGYVTLARLLIQSGAGTTERSRISHNPMRMAYRGPSLDARISACSFIPLCRSIPVPPSGVNAA
jgi:hypothetical protein